MTSYADLAEKIKLLEELRVSKIQFILGEKMTIIEKEKDIWVVENNTDLTEGRGGQYAQHVCEKKSTAIRLARKAGVQGSDAAVLAGKGYYIDKKWYYERFLTSPNKEDLLEERRLEEIEVKLKEKNLILEKAMALGLTAEEIAKLKE